MADDDYPERLRTLASALRAGGEPIEQAAILAELQRVSAVGLRDSVARARQRGVSWRELACAVRVAATTLYRQYRSGHDLTAAGYETADETTDETADETTDGAAGEPPVSLDTFVGRDRELADLRPLSTHSRLVTLTGPAGVGKTRLAS
jgi:hypothetical protein